MHFRCNKCRKSKFHQHLNHFVPVSALRYATLWGLRLWPPIRKELFKKWHRGKFVCTKGVISSDILYILHIERLRDLLTSRAAKAVFLKFWPKNKVQLRVASPAKWVSNEKAVEMLGKNTWEEAWAGAGGDLPSAPGHTALDTGHCSVTAAGGVSCLSCRQPNLEFVCGLVMFVKPRKPSRPWHESGLWSYTTIVGQSGVTWKGGVGEQVSKSIFCPMRNIIIIPSSDPIVSQKKNEVVLVVLNNTAD